MSWLLDASSDAWLQVAGRAHPLLLHVPIGALVLLVILELWWWLRRRDPDPNLRRLLASCVALSAAAAAGSGWLLGEEAGGSDMVTWHRWLGVAFASALALAALSALVGRPRGYVRMLQVSVLLAAGTGHVGGELTHGEGFLTEPLTGPASSAASGTASSVAAGAESGQPLAWSDHPVGQLLAERCAGCHGERRTKGGLALHTLEAALAGGESGPVLVPGDPQASELVRRALLPDDHDDRMPPPSKAALAPAEQELLRAWVLAGAGLEPVAGVGLQHDVGAQAGSAPVASVTASRISDAGASTSSETGAAQPAFVAPVGALAALAASRVHVEPVDPARGLLWVQCAAAADLPPSRLAELLTPVAEGVVELSLAATAADDGTLAALPTMPWLESLDLSRTAVTSAGLEQLARHPRLERLVLTGTSLDAGAVQPLAALPSLRRLAAWDAGLDADVMAALRSCRPDLDLGPGGGAGLATLAPLEQEPEVVLGADPALVPGNSTCPVSGDAVDPRFQVVYAGRVVAFCCSQCPQAFWADPEAYPMP